MYPSRKILRLNNCLGHGYFISYLTPLREETIKGIKLLWLIGQTYQLTNLIQQRQFFAHTDLVPFSQEHVIILQVKAKLLPP